MGWTNPPPDEPAETPAPDQPAIRIIAEGPDFVLVEASGFDADDPAVSAVMNRHRRLVLAMLNKLGEIKGPTANEVIAALSDLLGSMIGLHAGDEDHARQMLKLAVEVTTHEVESVIKKRNKKDAK